MSGLVAGIDYLSLPSTDLDRSIDFYANVVGLERGKLWAKSGDVSDAMGAEFETGTVTVALVASDRIGIEFQANKVPLALHVDDVEAARSELESRGVEFAADTMDSGVCHMAFFNDPDGNSLCLHHRYAPPEG